MRRIAKLSFLKTLLIPALIVILTARLTAQIEDPKSTTHKYAAALQIINYAYVEPVNEPELVEKAIIATLKELDPHSQYISREDLQKANEPLEGNYEGIGVTFQIHNDTILIISPIAGGPSEKLGIRAGDKIVKIEGEEATGEQVDNDFVFDRLRGEKGTEVRVSIFRKGKKNLLDFTIVRDKIPINSIDAGYMATDEIGYIRLNRFSRTSIDEFREAISKLKNEGMSKLILDLRGNSGGYLDVAVDLADEFLDYGKMIVYTEGASSPKRKYTATSKGNYEEGKMVVLIDEGSASASEIVSGAVQDWDRGLILGRRSFGKGLVQRPYILPDSSVIRLTIARYHTPSGRCIQRPYGNGTEKYYDDITNRISKGELTHADSIDFPDSLKYFTSKHRIVYGGGGIMPDIFIPWDSTRYTDYYMELLSEGVFNDFVIRYIDNHRNILSRKYDAADDFTGDFEIDEKTLKEFKSFADSFDEIVKPEEPGDMDPLIRQYLKALIARNLFDLEAYLKIMNNTDDGYLKAIEVLKDESYFSLLARH